MDLLVEEFSKFIDSQELANSYLLAFSGGLDSHVLLHLMASMRVQTPSLSFRVIHVNHGVNPSAAEWSLHCARICESLQVECIQESIDTAFENSLEDQLRQSRYQLFQNHLRQDEVLLTAHHQDDQAETILLQLFRGAGPQGLAAMPVIKSFGRGLHARPLLNFTREALLQYANRHKLQWIEDESNLNSKFTRNFLRHEILPILSKRWPTITKTLSRVAENCADAQKFIETSARALLVKTQGKLSETLSVEKIRLLQPEEQRQVLRTWIADAGFLLPSAVKLQQIMQTVLLARADKMPYVSWYNVELRRYRDDLFLMKKLPPHDANQIISWDISKPLELPGIGVLTAGVLLHQIDGKKITVRFRQGGEMLQLPGRQHHQELKKLFQQWGVLPWLRDRIPLIYVDQILWAVGVPTEISTLKIKIN